MVNRKPSAVILPHGSHYQRLFGGDILAPLRERAAVVSRPEERPFSAEELREHAATATVFIVGWGGPLDRLTDDVLDAAPALRCVAAAVLSPDSRKHTEALVRRGIAFVDCSWPVQHAVAEYTLGMIITGLRRVWEHDASLRAGGPWRDPAFMPNRELAESCVGVVGAGRVGRRVIEALRPWPCRIVVSDPFVSADEVKALGATLLPLPQLLAEADAVTLHVQRDDTSRGLIGRTELAHMRDGALLINAGRAAAVDGAALLAELETGRLRAVLDVFEPEPPPPDHPYFRLHNVIVTPHIAGHTPTMFRRCGRATVEAVIQHLD
jgi:phosphoglycerate dehydrogenase-like enzyme